MTDTFPGDDDLEPEEDPDLDTEGMGDDDDPEAS